MQSDIASPCFASRSRRRARSAFGSCSRPSSSTRWGALKGRLLHLSYGQCALFLTMMNEVDGQVQGGAVKFPGLSFDSGISRARMNPKDGQVYVCGLKGWQTRAARDGTFQRVRYTNKPVQMPEKLSVGKDTITIGFTTPLDPETAGDVDSYSIQQWNYVWSEDYGSPELSVSEPEKLKHDEVPVESVEVSPDRKSVTLHIPGLRPVMQMRIAMNLDTADGQTLEYEIYHTINRVPGQSGKFMPPTTLPASAREELREKADKK